MIKGKKINEILGLNAVHSLYSKDSSWYHSLSAFPGILFDPNGYVKFETEQQYLEHPSLQHRQDLHVTDGIDKLAGYIKFSTTEKAKIKDYIK
jgi:hypothetical protein